MHSDTTCPFFRNRRRKRLFLGPVMIPDVCRGSYHVNCRTGPSNGWIGMTRVDLLLYWLACSVLRGQFITKCDGSPQLKHALCCPVPVVDKLLVVEAAGRWVLAGARLAPAEAGWRAQLAADVIARANFPSKSLRACAGTVGQ